MDLSGSEGILGLAFVLLFLGLMVGFRVFLSRRPILRLRDNPSFTRLRKAVALAVEDGTRLHLSLGSGGLTGPESASAFVGLSMLRRVADITSVSDEPPIVTTGDGSLAILAQDTLQSAYQAMDAEDQFSVESARLTGLTPFSFAAGTMPIIADEMVSSSLLAGSFVNEVALITEANDRQEGFSMAGSDDVTGQAILFAAAEEPLVGEELFAGGAYLEAGPMHNASLHAQDVLRYLIILLIFLGAVLRFLGVLS